MRSDGLLDRSTSSRSAGSEQTLVSAVLATCDRPSFLAIALECYRRQTYSPLELIVVDDGQHHPVDRAAVEAVGGRLIRLDRRTSLGTKLNLGVEAARGPWCVKLDDDDFYAPNYVATLVDAVTRSFAERCRPTLAFMAPFVFFDLHAWETRMGEDSGMPGATMLFAREDWRERPFRPISSFEDIAFATEQIALGVTPMPVWAPGAFVVVRHHRGTDRGHSWTRHSSGPLVEDYVRSLPRYRRPEALLPRWVRLRYQEIQRSAVVSSGVREPAWTSCR